VSSTSAANRSQWWPWPLIAVLGFASIVFVFYAIAGHGAMMYFEYLSILVAGIALIQIPFTVVATIALIVSPRQRTKPAYVAVSMGLLLCAATIIPAIVG
jgi:hypothetical protein